ncbi:hypothetical protein D3C76_1797080 [compost metagenome]
MNKDPVSDETFEYLQFYGAKISTDRGDMIIDYRNESNGYYGGDIHWPGGSYYQSASPHQYQWGALKDAG